MNYKNSLKEDQGITLMVLIITIVILAILLGATATISSNSIIETQKFSFASELDIIQQKMLVINKEIQLGSTAYDNIGIKYDNLDTNKKQKVEQILNQNGVTDYSKYILVSKEDLLKIGLKNIEQNVIISYENSIVYSYDGIKLNGNMYYSIGELENL